MNMQTTLNASNRRTQATRGHVPGIGLIAEVVNRWMERRRSRRDLAGLDERLLRDIGLTRGEARTEAAVPFWKP